MQNNGITKKFEICEKNRAKNLREAAKFLEDNVYTRIADLNTDKRMLSADIYYHSDCLTKYIQKFNSAKSSSLPKNDLANDWYFSITWSLLRRLFHVVTGLLLLRFVT